MSLWLPSLPASAATFYVRMDGGSAQQCDGRANARYTGQGKHRSCAWNSPHAALPGDGPVPIAGGDTLIITPGSYRIGWGAPGAEGGRCEGVSREDCTLAPIPSGLDATHRTRILGICAAPARLWGGERVRRVLDLEGSSHVEIGCLDVSDHSDCVDDHDRPAARCRDDAPPYGDWASIGIQASASSDVWLHDLDIHGLAHGGIRAGGLHDWTVERVKILANGWVGWDGDIGAGSSDSGRIVLRHVEIGWNGCGERWQTRAPWACWAQIAGGYGDGLGTARTGGQWLIEDSEVHHNTSDGIDLLYLDGAPSTSVVIRRTRAEGNAGNQIKTTGTALIENSIVVGNCAFFAGRDDIQPGDPCRALGNALSIGLADGQAVRIIHNTITGQGDCLIVTGGGDARSQVVIRNNLLLGQPDYTAGGREQTCGHYSQDEIATLDIAGNAFWQVKSGQCLGDAICGRDPRIASARMDSFDGTPLPGSPLIGAATPDDVKADFHGAARPLQDASIGALEPQR